MSIELEIAPLRDGEGEVGRTTTPEPTGARYSWQKRSPGTTSLSPIGSPAPNKEAEKLLSDKDRPHANSFTFCDPFRAEERPNSAPAERALGIGSACSANDSLEEASNESFTRRMPTQVSKPLSPEQATFHPQPRRHWVTALLESEASPNLQSPGAAKASRATRPKSLSWDEPGAQALTPVADLGAVATPALMEDSTYSTPSPEHELATARLTGEKELDSPNPAMAHRSIQNTPEPTHYHYGSFLGSAGAPISTPSPCAMSALNNQHFLALPRFPDSGLPLPGAALADGSLGPVLPPPLPTGSGPASEIGMGFGGAFRPGAEPADGDRPHPVEAKPMAPAELPTFWGLRAQDQMVHQMAAAAAGYQAYQWGAAAAAAALGGLQGAGWRLPGCHGCMDVGQVQSQQMGQAKMSGPVPVLTKESGPVLAPGPVSPACPAQRTQNMCPNSKSEEWHGSTEPRKGRVCSEGGKGRPANALQRGKFDPAALPAEAAELLGQVGQLSRSQAGSKYLQRQLQKGPGAISDVILAEVEDEIAGMMCDSYGNYLCSAAFQACSPGQRKRILEKLSPQVPGIACDKRGTHALQALIGF